MSGGDPLLTLSRRAHDAGDEIVADLCEYLRGAVDWQSRAEKAERELAEVRSTTKGSARKQEVIERLCDLVGGVNAELTDFAEASDCFCGKTVPIGQFQYEETALSFVEKAVREALLARKAPPPVPPMPERPHASVSNIDGWHVLLVSGNDQVYLGEQRTGATAQKLSANIDRFLSAHWPRQAVGEAKCDGAECGRHATQHFCDRCADWNICQTCGTEREWECPECDKPTPSPAEAKACGKRDDFSPRRCTLPEGHPGNHHDARCAEFGGCPACHGTGREAAKGETSETRTAGTGDALPFDAGSRPDGDATSVAKLPETHPAAPSSFRDALPAGASVAGTSPAPDVEAMVTIKQEGIWWMLYLDGFGVVPSGVCTDEETIEDSARDLREILATAARRARREALEEAADAVSRATSQHIAFENVVALAAEGER